MVRQVAIYIDLENTVEYITQKTPLNPIPGSWIPQVVDNRGLGGLVEEMGMHYIQEISFHPTILLGIPSTNFLHLLLIQRVLGAIELMQQDSCFRLMALERQPLFIFLLSVSQIFLRYLVLHHTMRKGHLLAIINAIVHSTHTCSLSHLTSLLAFIISKTNLFLT